MTKFGRPQTIRLLIFGVVLLVAIPAHGSDRPLAGKFRLRKMKPVRLRANRQDLRS